MEGSILDKCFKRCLVTKQYYKGIYAIDTIPFNSIYPSFIVVNTAPSTSNGEHWIVLFFINEGLIEIFDSLGQSPYAYGIHFKRYIESKKHIKFVYTNKRFQSLKSNVCGAHCLFFGYKKCQKKLALSTLVNRYYLNDTNYNDCFVLCFISRKFAATTDQFVIQNMLKTVSSCNLTSCV